MKRIPIDEDVHSFENLVRELSGEDISKCIQCGKCSAGCPVATEMDYLTNQIIELIQINSKDEVLKSSTIWLCASCETCFTRCPEEIDLAKIMDTLRRLSIKEGYAPAEKNVVAFNKIFLDSIEKYGRIHELGMAIRYNLKSGNPFKDAALGPALFSRGKISILPKKIKGIEQIRNIFSKSEKT